MQFGHLKFPDSSLAGAAQRHIDASHKPKPHMCHLRPRTFLQLIINFNFKYSCCLNLFSFPHWLLRNIRTTNNFFDFQATLSSAVIPRIDVGASRERHFLSLLGCNVARWSTWCYQPMRNRINKMCLRNTTQA